MASCGSASLVKAKQWQQGKPPSSLSPPLPCVPAIDCCCSNGVGVVFVASRKPVLELGQCNHTTVIKDMCADCGADLRQDEPGANCSKASVPMVHSVPELKVTETLAKKLGQADTERLLNDRKLVLLVDLDQTLIHTTNDNVPNNLKVSSLTTAFLVAVY